MHGRWSNRSHTIYSIETHLWSVEGIQISDPSSEPTPATLARSCPAFIAPRCQLSARRVVHLVIQSSNWQPHVQASCYDRFFDIDKNRVLALVAHSLHTLEVWANRAQFVLPTTLPSLWVLILGGSVRVEKHSKRGSMLSSSEALLS